MLMTLVPKAVALPWPSSLPKLRRAVLLHDATHAHCTPRSRADDVEEPSSATRIDIGRSIWPGAYLRFMMADQKNHHDRHCRSRRLSSRVRGDRQLQHQEHAPMPRSRARYRGSLTRPPRIRSRTERRFPVQRHHRAQCRRCRGLAAGWINLKSKEFPMKALATAAFSLCLVVQAPAQTAATKLEGAKTMPTTEDIRAVAPALEKYAKTVVLGDLWKRPGLPARDRSIVTVAALIARDQMVELPYYLNLAIDNGVKPAEISEIITHLAFYTGWANAINAVPAAKDVFKNRNIGADQLPPASGPQLPLDEAAEAQRATRVGQQFGQITPSLVQYTTDILFRDLWLRPGLAPRDRSLVTVSALVASGQVAQITYHLNRAMDNGLTQEEAGEVVTHLAFYAGWPNAFSALPVVKDVFEKRPR